MGEFKVKISNVNKKRLATLLLTSFLLLPGCQSQPQKAENTTPVLTIMPTEQMHITEVPEEIIKKGYIAMPQTDLEMKEIMLNNSNIFRYNTSKENIYVELIARIYHGIKVDENNEIMDTIYSANLLDLKDCDYYLMNTKVIRLDENVSAVINDPKKVEQVITFYDYKGDSNEKITISIPLEYSVSESLSNQLKEMPQKDREIMVTVEQNKQNTTPYYVIHTTPLFQEDKSGNIKQVGTKRVLIDTVDNIIGLSNYVEEGTYDFEETQCVYRGYTKSDNQNGYTYTGISANLLDLKECDYYTVSTIRVPMVDLESRLEEAKQNYYPEIPKTQEEIDKIMANSRYYKTKDDGNTYEYIVYYRGIKIIDGKIVYTNWCFDLNDLKECTYYEQKAIVRLLEKELESTKTK